MKITTKILKTTSISLFLGIGLAGCGGADNYLNNNDDPIDPPVDPITTEVSLDIIQANVFTPNCSGCHTVGGAAEFTGVFLDSTTNTFNTLVGQTSFQASPEIRVIPNDAEDSYLVQKLEGRASVGTVMPPAGALSTDLISNVRAWIDSGALQDDSVATSTKIFGAELNTNSQTLSFSVQLSGVLDADTSVENMVLVYQIVDGISTLSQASDVKTVYSGSTITITYLGDVNIDQLEVQINNPDVISIIDSQGRLLDGNGDGEPGGMFVFMYPDDVEL